MILESLIALAQEAAVHDIERRNHIDVVYLNAT
jgi:hypothetical protein